MSDEQIWKTIFHQTFLKNDTIFFETEKIEKIFRFRVSCLQLVSMSVQQLYNLDNYFVALKIHWINLFSEWNILVQLHHQWK